jgi:HK97 family phage prohead protease
MEQRQFNFYIPLTKSKESGLTIQGVASTISLDKDEEKMSFKALQMMNEQINSMAIPIFGNHEHNWENTLGVTKSSFLNGNELNISVNLDDPQLNPKIPQLLKKLELGIPLGFSVGGTVTDFKWEMDKEIGKRVKVIDGVKLYEVSVVGIPSNSDSFISIPNAISKSLHSKGLNIKRTSHICPLCFTQKGANTQCQICFY